ncbi:MAG: acyltransferase [Pseudonocardiales bacterium]|nr:acyltransferase [Pseudonocardiales bacterium]
MNRKEATFGNSLGGHANGFGALRLLFAAAVIFDHSFVLGGFSGNRLESLSNGQTSLGGLAVFGFFAISGYLITSSAKRGDVVQFLWRRGLRILPAFWVVLGVAAFIVGPLYWLRSGGGIGDYLARTPGGPVEYLTGNWRLRVEGYGIRNVFSESPYGLKVQGSVLDGTLWTLIYEWRCYLLIAVLMAVGVIRRAPAVLPVIAGYCAYLEVGTWLGLDLPMSGLVAPFVDRWTLVFVYIFATAGALALYADRIPVDWRLASAAGALFVTTLCTGGLLAIGLPAAVYVVLWAAARAPAALHSVGGRNDYSYGVYLYGFIVQQGLASMGVHRYGYLPYLVVSAAGTAVCAWLSWHVVEKQAMKLKGHGPGRGVLHWLGAAGVGPERAARPEPSHAR